MKFFKWLKSIRARREKLLKDSPIIRETGPIRIQEPKHQNETSTQVYPQKRRYKRYVVEGMEIHAKMVFEEVVELFNVSIGGACIITTKTLKPGDNIILRFKDENINRPLKCMIIWENEAEDEAKESLAIFHKAGVQFKEITPDTLIKLKDYMREFGIPDEKEIGDEYKSSALRFKIYKNEKAVMNYPVSYPVKKISLGGMLVKTDRAFEIEQRYPMAIYFPKDNNPIKFQGRIASKIPIKDDQMHNYDIGIEILNLAENDKSMLNRFLYIL